jgi:aspartyl-tRNA(Asn)/glutamyl-tRNA(Gln) amidotransferase subunit A
MAIVNEDVFFAGIADLTKALRAREFSAVELARAFCKRLEKLGPTYNALAYSLKKEAIRKAKDADEEIQRERYRPLQGIPYGVKDLIAVAKYPTAWGARPYAGQMFDENATVVNKLNKAGAVCIGKLAMVELAGGGGYRYPSASITGPGLNPWDRTRWSGGSSSGSGIAVAAGLVTFALGSETSGSILTPSAFCGVTGLRPTYGLVSRHGCMALSWTLDKIGPMCRSAEDCGLVLQAISGGDYEDPESGNKSFYYSPRFARPAKDLVIGYAPADFEEWAEPSARPDLQGALAAVKSMGARMKEVELPDFPYGAILSTVLNGEMGAIFEELIRSGRVNELADKRQIAGLKASLDLPASEYLKAMRARALVQDAIRRMFFDVDLLLAPSRTGPAPKITDRLDAPPARERPKSRGLNGMIPMGNLVGYPAISLPCGFAEKLPVAISFVGRPWFENQLIALGVEFQSRTDWHKRRPPAA